MASRDELVQALKQADAAGDTAGATTLARSIRALDAQQGAIEGVQAAQAGSQLPQPAQAPKTQPQASNTRLQPMALPATFPLPATGDLKAAIQDQPMLDTILAGYGTAPTEAYQSLKQWLGKEVNPQDIENQRSIAETGPGMVGNLAGNISMLAAPGGGAIKAIESGAKYLPKALGAAIRFMAAPAQSAAESAAFNPVKEGESRAENALKAAVFTKALQAAGKTVSGLVSPSKEAQILIEKGVNPTVSQAAPKSILGYAEDVMASIPFIGRATRANQQRAEQELVNVGATRAAAFPQYRMPRTDEFPVGRGEHFIEGAEDFNQAYQDILQNKQIPVSSLFKTQLGTAARAELVGVPSHYQRKFEQDMNNFIPKNTGAITGEAWKDIQSNMRQRSRQYRKGYETSGRGEDMDMAKAYEVADQHLSRIRNNAMSKDDVTRLDEIDEAWAHNVIMKKAASYRKQEGDYIGSANLIKAVEDLTPDELLIKKQGRMQDLMEPAKTVFAKEGNRDAFERRIGNLASGAVVGVGAGMSGLPLAALPAALALGHMGSTEMGSKLLLGRYALQQKLAELLRNWKGQGALAATGADLSPKIPTPQR